MKLSTLTLAATLLGGAAFAADVGPNDVTFSDGAVEISLTGVAGDPAAGAAVMVKRPKGNCVACHAITALSNAPFHGDVGPTLDGAADRWSEAQLRGIVVDSKRTFEGSVMPGFYKVGPFIRPGDNFTGKAAQGELPPLLTAQEVEDVVAFLMTLKE